MVRGRLRAFIWRDSTASMIRWIASAVNMGRTPEAAWLIGVFGSAGVVAAGFGLAPLFFFGPEFGRAPPQPMVIRFHLELSSS